MSRAGLSRPKAQIDASRLAADHLVTAATSTPRSGEFARCAALWSAYTAVKRWPSGRCTLVSPPSSRPTVETKYCACRKSNPDMFVMQSAADWAAKNAPCPLNRTR
jgi:hypothetical protein